MFPNLVLTAFSLSTLISSVTSSDSIVYISPTTPQFGLDNADQTCLNQNRNLFEYPVGREEGSLGINFCPSWSQNSTYVNEGSTGQKGVIAWYSAHLCIRTPDLSNEYCIYYSPSFANDRGIVLISPPSLAGTFFNSSAFTSPITEGEGQEIYPAANTPPSFVERELPGKGKGLIANRTIKRGELILLSRPVIIIGESSYDTLPEEQRLPFQRKAVEFLGKGGKNMFDGLAGHWGGDDVEDQIVTNAFGVIFGNEGKSFGVVVPEAARLNHDCRPNARFAFDPDTLIHKVHAVRDIKSGEELSISYIDEKQPLLARQQYILTHWGFPCSCTHCSAPLPSIALSDTRVATLVSLRSQLLDFTPNRGKTATPSMALQLIDLYEAEDLHSGRAEGYMLAAARFCIWEDEERTREYAQLALDNWMMWEKRGQANLKMLRGLVGWPRGSWCWGLGAEGQDEL